ncbi:MAG: BREX-1 system adenine-specific DNA-methyltransferase PglX [Gallionella sp.]|jgi:type II restriction/modification system DNA methylase subunit YeeA
METTKLRRFAQYARRSLMEQVSTKLGFALADDSAARRENPAAVADLQKQISESSQEQVIEKVAYIWFNRFCALRFMDMNGYTRIRVVSPADEGQFQPEILAEAKAGHIDADMVADSVRQRISALLSGSVTSSDPQQEAYRLLVVAACNDFHRAMPYLFERISDYTELLMPDDLLSGNSILAYTREAMTPDACQDVEVIGWLYQFYISEKKDEVFEGLKKNKKITPENIPAATQLFTPHWIVRYLVENSLGRLWMLNHPNSRLTEKMEYYIAPQEVETDFLRIAKPEDIKLCDPACGSGHMLTYAFDLLYAIYEEVGIDPSEIPVKILTHNLYGIEIDERAGELAAFALTMKARAKQRRFFNKGIRPNICVLQRVKIELNDLNAYVGAVGRDLFTANLRTLLTQFEEADNFGSLIRPVAMDYAELRRVLAEKGIGDDLLLEHVHHDVLLVLEQAEYLSQRYQVVVANPPYMGGKGMNPNLKGFLERDYTAVKSDLFSSFVVRCSDIALSKACIGIMSPNVWMYISSHENLRQFLVGERTINSLVELPLTGFKGATVQICAYVFQNIRNKNRCGAFVRLVDFKGGDDEMSLYTLEAIHNPQCGWYYKATTEDFEKLPGMPIAYWISDSLRAAFASGSCLRDFGEPRLGMATGNNETYLRLWYEISRDKFGLGFESRKQAKDSGKKWFPYNKGGQFRRWYGNNEYVVNWENDGSALQNTLHPSGSRIWAHNFNLDYIFKPCLTFTATSSSYFGIRFSEAGFLFDNKGSSYFSDARTLKPVLGLLASKPASFVLKAINPTVEFQPGNISVIPFFKDQLQPEISDRVEKIVDISKVDWNLFEVSWDFKVNPLLGIETSSSQLNILYSELRSDWRSMVVEMRELEAENNLVFIRAYGLQHEVNEDVETKEITLNCNPNYRYGGNKSEQELEDLLRADTMREFISYAVGCMFGRYSLDKPGLILANQGETLEDYLRQVSEPTFMPDTDNVIPILDGDWFTDDISERFRAFLRVTFGDEHYEENLRFIEEAVGKDIRKYFLKDFYNDHVKRYKKRPIYWLFSSPKGSFNALIYLHRYRPDTVSVVLNDYLRDFNSKLTARKSHLEHVSVSGNASAAEKTKALKDIENLKKILVELEDYERDVLYPLATLQREINLDDGVKYNYGLFGNALKKIVGLDATED